jgi:hypothetical protein
MGLRSGKVDPMRGPTVRKKTFGAARLAPGIPDPDHSQFWASLPTIVSRSYLTTLKLLSVALLARFRLYSFRSCQLQLARGHPHRHLESLISGSEAKLLPWSGQAIFPPSSRCLLFLKLRPLLGPSWRKNPSSSVIFWSVQV